MAKKENEEGGRSKRSERDEKLKSERITARMRRGRGFSVDSLPETVLKKILIGKREQEMRVSSEP